MSASNAGVGKGDPEDKRLWDQIREQAMNQGRNQLIGSMFPGAGLMIGGANLFDRLVPDHMQDSPEQVRDRSLANDYQRFLDMVGGGMPNTGGSYFDLGFDFPTGGAPTGSGDAFPTVDEQALRDRLLHMGQETPFGGGGGGSAPAGSTFDRYLERLVGRAGGGGGGGRQRFDPVSILGSGSYQGSPYSSGIEGARQAGPPKRLNMGKGGGGK